MRNSSMWKTINMFSEYVLIKKFNNKSDVIHDVEIQINNTMTMINESC